ncbi:hypothetical protein [Herpetosiphon sp. NSE202]|uniref:hypothetical protein n=1 Tax=Herpetosiphon sp. NSE202 TaxID=3351349 RepID=UPI0036381285
MNKQIYWRSIAIVVLCAGCSSHGPKRTSMPKIPYPASANFQHEPTPLGLNQPSRTITYTTELSTAEIVQYYVNETKLGGWDKVFIREPDHTLELASMECPIIAMTVIMSPTTLYTNVSLHFSQDDCI